MLLTKLYSQNIPEGYILQYSQDFSHAGAIKDFRFNEVHAWSVEQVKGNGALIFRSVNDTISGDHIPFLTCILSGFLFGDFILELRIMQTNEDAGGPLWILFGIRDSIRYYCVNITPIPGDSTSNLYVVDNSLPVKVQPEFTETIPFVANKWHKIRIERNIVDKSVRVFIDDLKKPCLSLKDRKYIMGYIGFGSDNGSGRIDDIKIWSQTVIPVEADFLEQKE